MDEPRVEIEHAGLERRGLGLFFDYFIDLALGLFDRLLDFCRLDAAVDDQILKRDARDRAAQRVVG